MALLCCIVGRVRRPGLTAFLHRAPGVHISRVRSLELDDWRDTQVDVMKRIGNAKGGRGCHGTWRRCPFNFQVGAVLSQARRAMVLPFLLLANGVYEASVDAGVKPKPESHMYVLPLAASPAGAPALLPVTLAASLAPRQ